MLGTYNVRQCVVIHIINQNMNLHGLAHIDNHTEINSLNYFWSDLKLNSQSDNIIIEVIGPSSPMVMGLNNSKTTLNKTKKFFEEKGKDITSQITERSLKKDFLVASVDGKSEITDALSHGIEIENRALHSIQAIKRKDIYFGTYQIIRANDAANYPVFSDERARVMLNKYKKDPKWEINQ
jgi:hypothetical protein